MSSTRSNPDGPYRQERYASSPEFQRGLAAHLVAKKCELLDHPQDRALLYFIQRLSHDEGGLPKLIKDLLALYPERFGTHSMLEFKLKPDQWCDATQARRIRGGILKDATEELAGRFFPVKGDKQRHAPLLISESDPCFADLGEHEQADMRRALAREAQRQAALPDGYPARAFFERCWKAAGEHLAKDLSDFCLDPEWTLSEPRPWYCADLVSILRDYQARRLARLQAGFVTTEIARRIDETLEYTLQERCMTLVYGMHRLGKSTAARHWCDCHSGQARFVEVPPGNDDISFFRAIAQALGISAGTGFKAVQLRERIEATLSTGHLALVMDEGHRLWPDRNLRDAVPFRVSWVMAMVNAGVPISLITTPQFFNSQKQLEKRSGWNADQLVGRIAHVENLPETLGDADLEAVAKAFVPSGDADVVETLVLYAKSAAKYLKGIEDVVKRASFLARKGNRDNITLRDIKQAIEGSINPSDSALASALSDPPAKGRKTAVALPMDAPPQKRVIAPPIPQSRNLCPVTAPEERNRHADAL